MGVITIEWILEVPKDEAETVAGAFLASAGIKEESLGSMAMKELVQSAIEKSTPATAGQFADLIAGLVAAKLEVGHDDSNMHKAAKAFQEAGLLSHKDLELIAKKIEVQNIRFCRMGGDLIIRYLCGIEL